MAGKQPRAWNQDLKKVAWWPLLLAEPVSWALAKLTSLVMSRSWEREQLDERFSNFPGRYCKGARMEAAAFFDHSGSTSESTELIQLSQASYWLVSSSLIG